jgi:hypothetical protein
MCGSSQSYNFPEQPSYGEGMADALKAQVELLTGKGDFAEIAPDGLEGLLPLEENIRKKTAQTDTDVLKQTLLGNTSDAVTGKYDSEGRFVVGQEPTTKTETKLVNIPYRFEYQAVDRDKYIGNGQNVDVTIYADGKYVGKRTFYSPKGASRVRAEEAFKKSNWYEFYKDGTTVERKTETKGDPKPIYAKDQSGNIITDKSKAGQSGTLPAERLGDGMLDLLGDSRNVEEFTTREATQEDVNAGLASEVGESITEATGNRKAGFDEQGNFLGLSALAEDIQRGNLSRQREADLADVERLSDRYRGVMEDYKPAATSGLDDARILLEQQRENLTGLRKPTQAELDADPSLDPDSLINTGTGSGGPVTIPTDDTYGGDVTAATMDAAQVADPLQLQANTKFQGDLATGTGNDTLRSALLGDAKTALDSGLTDREQAQIANAARARQTLMGRTFDQSGAIAEAEARVQEDNARRMQNRSFAQSVLGQEAGLQQGDITRGMAQESEQAGLQQRADLTQAQMDQQANAFDADALQRSRMGNQAQRQQANQFGVGAEMDAERLNETLRQQGLSNYINAVGNLAQMEDKFMLDPFQALLGRGGGNALQQGQSVFGQANYGLSSGPQYLNPEAGLGFISQMAANDANMYAANVAADASRSSGLMGGLGAIGGGLLKGAGAAASGGTTLLSGFCWVAREVYGPANPAWMQFREWMFTESPQWFFELYRKYGERFASWISDKPRLKGIIRKWMDSKIGDK